MSGIKPVRRWQPAFYPYKREKFGKRILTAVERLFKGALFGCRMCGNCLLQETAFICPMECPKGLRNGPCGGVTPSKMCYIDESRKCVWNCIYERALRTGRQDKLLEILPPMDWSKAGCETWGDVIRQVRKVGTGRFIAGVISGDRKRRFDTWESVFRIIRQPEWWQGDSCYHKAPDNPPVSGLEQALRSGRFVVATEIVPPLGASIDKLQNNIVSVRPYADVINFTDASSATPKMSAIACSKIALDLGAEPVFQIAARDTTRTGLQSSVIGACNLGIRNILCISGDSPVVGPSPASDMNILDIDSVQMLWILRRMRDEGIYLDGRKMKHPPQFFLGAASTPFACEPYLQAIRDQKKINAGAQFIQTNIIFDTDRLDLWLEQLDKKSLLDKVYILIGVAPLKNYKTACYLHQKVPGVFLPDRVLRDMEKAGEDAPEAGVQIALGVIDNIKKKKGINGIHLMTLGWESVVERIARESGLAEKTFNSK